MKVSRSLFKYSISSIESADIFSRPILPYYKGKTRFKSMIGELLTIFIFILGVYILITSLQDVAGRKKVNVKQQITYRDSFDFTGHEIMQTGVKLMFVLLTKNWKPMDEKHAYIHVTLTTIGDKGNNKDFKRKNLTLGRGTQEDFPIDMVLSVLSYEEFIDEYNPLCIKDKSIELYGQSLLSRNQYLEVRARKGLKAGGANEDEVEAESFGARLKVIYANTYIDYYDHDNPIKKYVQEIPEIVYSDINKPERSFAFIKENRYKLRDSTYDNDIKQEGIFYSIEDILEANTVSNTFVLSSIYIYISPEIIEHERSYFTYWEMVAQIGGYFEMISVGGSVLVSISTSKHFGLSILEQFGNRNKKKIHPGGKEVENLANRCKNGVTEYPNIGGDSKDYRVPSINLKDYLIQSFQLTPITCCKKQREKNRAIAERIKQFKKDFDGIEIVESIRILKREVQRIKLEQIYIPQNNKVSPNGNRINEVEGELKEESDFGHEPFHKIKYLKEKDFKTTAIFLDNKEDSKRKNKEKPKIDESQRNEVYFDMEDIDDIDSSGLSLFHSMRKKKKPKIEE